MRRQGNPGLCLMPNEVSLEPIAETNQPRSNAGTSTTLANENAAIDHTGTASKGGPVTFVSKV